VTLAHKRKQKFFFYFGCSLVRRFYCKITKLLPRTGRTDRRTDRHTDRVQRNMRPPPREEGRVTICKRAAATSCRATLFSPRGRRSALRRRADGNNVAAVSHGQHLLTPTAAAANTAMRKRGLCCQWLNENVESKKSSTKIVSYTNSLATFTSTIINSKV